jgi:hypothetical protein
MAAITLSACGAVKNENGTTSNSNNTKVTQETSKTELKSLKDLFALGSTQKCTFEVKDKDGLVTKSEIVVSGKKFKQVTELTTEEGINKVYSVSDGTYFYSWNDKIKNSGLKMKLEEVEKGEQQNNAQGTPAKSEKQMADINQKFDYKCTPATLSESDLAIPTDVKFVDFSEMMKGLQNMNLDELKKLAPQE